MRGGRGASPPRRGRGELEGEVLTVLWAADGPISAAQVQQILGTGLAHNTVQTILVRLHQKGLAVRSPQGRAHLYAPARGQAESAAGLMHEVLGDQDHQAVLQHFVGQLSPEDAATLSELLLAAPRPTSPRRRPSRR